MYMITVEGGKYVVDIKHLLLLSNHPTIIYQIKEVIVKNVCKDTYNVVSSSSFLFLCPLILKSLIYSISSAVIIF